jgi:stearoyl-CoA desaturase (delta-9 desaturase)
MYLIFLFFFHRKSLNAATTASGVPTEVVVLYWHSFMSAANAGLPVAGRQQMIVERTCCVALVCAWAFFRVGFFMNPVLTGGVLFHVLCQTIHDRSLEEAGRVVHDLTSLPADGTEWERLCRYLDVVNGYLLKYSGSALWFFMQPLFLLAHDLWQRRDLPLLAMQRVGMVLALCTMYCTLANISSHRYFSHRSFQTSRPFQFLLACCGAVTGQSGPLWWASSHVAHHRHCETEEDPHCPGLHGFLHAHVLWLCKRTHFATNLRAVSSFRAYPELWLCSVFSVDLHRVFTYSLLPECLNALLPASFCNFHGIDLTVISQLRQAIPQAWGLSLHAEAFINSYCHVSTPSETCVGRDVRWVAYLNGGEGWHALHHAEPRCAYHGHERGLDLTYWVIRALERLGVVWGIVQPASCNIPTAKDAKGMHAKGPSDGRKSSPSRPAKHKTS